MLNKGYSRKNSKCSNCNTFGTSSLGRLSEREECWRGTSSVIKKFSIHVRSVDGRMLNIQTFLKGARQLVFILQKRLHFHLSFRCGKDFIQGTQVWSQRNVSKTFAFVTLSKGHLYVGGICWWNLISYPDLPRPRGCFSYSYTV